MSPASEQKPRLLVIAGPNGAGKTTVTERGLAYEWFAGCQYINPDFIARDEFGDWNSPDAVLKAAQLASQLREEYFWLITRAWPLKPCFLRPIKSNSCIVHTNRVISSGCFSSQLPTRPSMLRVWLDELCKAGMMYPSLKSNRYFRSIAQCAVIVPWEDRLYLYDNSIDGEEAALILRVAEGKITKLYKQVPEWMAPILETLETTP